MKKSLIIMFFVFLSLNLVGAACTLTINFLNQDPDPAVPGDYVKLLFQLTGVENPECKYVSFKLLQDYPIIFDPNATSSVVIKGGTYTPRFDSSLTIPYKVRIDPDALDGDNPIRVAYSILKTEELSITKEFNLNVQDVRSDFEVYVKDYDSSKNLLTLEILNIEKNDVEALSIQIPKQENIIIKGSQTNIIGSLDSNDFTTADFEAIPSKGNINLIISYTDSINKRRTLNKTISFDPEFFKDRVRDKTATPTTTYLFLGAVVLIIVYIFYKRHQKHKKKKLLG